MVGYGLVALARNHKGKAAGVIGCEPVVIMKPWVRKDFCIQQDGFFSMALARGFARGIKIFLSPAIDESDGEAKKKQSPAHRAKIFISHNRGSNPFLTTYNIFRKLFEFLLKSGPIIVRGFYDALAWPIALGQPLIIAHKHIGFFPVPSAVSGNLWSPPCSCITLRGS